MSKKLLIIGAGEFADIAYEYFTVDSDYEVAGFAVEAEFLTEEEKFGLPVVALETVETVFPASEVEAHVAVTSTKLNRIRARLIEIARSKGYTLASFISPHAMVWRTAELGDNIFIFENNVVQHGVTIESGCVLWSGNHIGHQTRIREHCFLASHVVVSGYCDIGARSFVGVNATFADNVKIGEDCFVGMAAAVNKSFDTPGQILNGNPAEPAKVSSYRYFRIKQ
ncbi:acetyltransferase [Leisingera sp.]|uniref:acetyltransferase n=1 Tax=Leisingera sp. TaxID=1879318 RepID=UPI002B27973C|nr:acetyltransferase [Leisingera sp.]